MAQWTQTQAEQELTAWATANACRDDIITAAHQAGVTKARISTITGVARTTIDRILEGRPMRRSFLQMASQEEIANFLDSFIDDWPRDPTWNAGPFPFRPRPAMATTIDADRLAERLLATAEFRALRLGTWLNTPDGELIAAAVEQLTPPPYRMDIELLTEALKLAAKRQQTAERERAFGIGLVTAIGAVLLSGARN